MLVGAGGRAQEHTRGCWGRRRRNMLGGAGGEGAGRLGKEGYAYAWRYSTVVGSAPTGWNVGLLFGTAPR